MQRKGEENVVIIYHHSYYTITIWLEKKSLCYQFDKYLVTVSSFFVFLKIH